MTPITTRTPFRTAVAVSALVAGLLAPALIVTSAGAAPDSAAVVAAEAPVLTNGGFEEPSAEGAVPGWNLIGPVRPDTAFGVTDAAASEGTWSLSLSDDSATYSIGLESEPFDVEPGAGYAAQAMMNVERSQLGIYLRYYDAAGNRLTNVAEFREATSGAWVQTSVAAAVPEDAATGTVVLYSSTGGLGVGLVDDVAVVAVDVKPELPELDNPTPEEVVAQNPRLSHLGTPVTSKIVTNPVLGEEDGRPVVYGVYRGAGDTDSPAAFVVADAGTGEVVRSIPLPGAEGTFETRTATDGKVYFATTYDFNLWYYDPADLQVTKVGLVNPDQPSHGHAFAMTAGPDGSMYIGTYPKGEVYLYDPAAGFSNLGQIDSSQSYVKGLAYDFERDTLYVGVGGTRAQIYKITPDGTKSPLLSDETTPGARDETFASTFTFTGDRLFVRVTNQLLVVGADDQVEYWKGEGNEVHGYHVSARPDAPEKVVFTFGTTFWEYDGATATTRNLGIATNGYLTDSRWVELDDPEWPGYTMLAATNEGTVRMNPATGKSEAHSVDFANPVTVQKILTGPDSMYASGYMKGLAPFDSVTGEAGPTLQSGQYESSAVRGDTMLLGAYGNGRVLEYDPASGAGPRTLFDLKAEKQDRPFAMDYDEAGDTLYVGTVPYYGTHQGALTVYDFATGEKTVFTTEIVTDQAVISVLHHDGLVYLGTTLDGGLGAPPSEQTEAHFVVFDPATGQKVNDIVPVAGDEGVTGLMVGPDGLIWGVSEDTIFTYDPETAEIVYSEKVLGDRYGSSTVWAWAYLHVGADGKVYGTNRHQFFMIDPATMEYTQLVNGVGNYANVDAHGDILFSSGINIYKYDVPDPLVCDETITGDHAGPVQVTGGVLCVADATVDGPIGVDAGAALVVTESQISGPVNASGATTVAITDSTIDGPLDVAGSASALTIAGNEITGPVTLTDNATDDAPVIAGNTIGGPLACTGNEPAPTDDGEPNTVTGPRTGQCADL